MSRHYETIAIIHPDAGEEKTAEVIKKATAVIEEKEGVELDIDEWGRKRLAYPIKGKNEGYYVLFTYTAPPAASKELERIFKISEDVIRYQTVALKERIAKAPEVPATTETTAASETSTETAPKTEESKPAVATEAKTEGGDNE
ncbi:MAG: 30S ribosomal protein S6 [Deltaproteobacteria bacterium]|nr:30S ribosomal protein S6 [Deltaproteobacteria bacterium]